MKPARRLARPAFLALGLACLHASELGAQTLQGRVTEVGTRSPITAASILVIDARDRTRGDAATDTTGAFRVSVPGPGTYTIRIERVGYETALSQPITMAAGEVLLLEVELGVEAVPLEPVVVTERRESAVGWLREYYQRLNGTGRSGLGRFITRAEIERRNASFLSHLLVGRAFIRLVPDAFGNTHLVMGGGSSQCQPRIYVNGALASDSRLSIPIDQIVRPDELEGIEIYRSGWQVPPEYYRPGDCGVILAWTRADIDPDAKFSWKKNLIGLGGMLVLLFVGLN